MSTWISSISFGLFRRALRMAAVLLVLPLAGCLGEQSGALSFLSSGKTEDVARDVLRKVSLYEGDVVVGGPDGYCIDRRSIRRNKSGGFVLLASCESLSGVRGHEVEPILMTVSVLPDEAGDTRPGVAEIAASMAPHQVLAQREGKTLTLVHFAGGGDGRLPGGDARHWRGASVLNGHLLGFALYARKGSVSAGPEGYRMLVELEKVIRQSSPRRPPASPSSPVADTTAPPPRGLGSLLGGLFPDSG